MAVVNISLIGHFLLIFDNFENVYLFSNPNISAKLIIPKKDGGCTFNHNALPL